MLMHKKTMFDCYCCIQTHCGARKLENFEEKCIGKFVISAARYLWKMHVRSIHFENAASRAEINVMLTSKFDVFYRAGF